MTTVIADPVPSVAALEQAIQHQVAKRTGRRIRALQVQVMGNRMVVRGRAPCFYVQQLVIQGILDVIGSPSTMRIELDLEISGG
jgi:hypothetical protein